MDVGVVLQSQNTRISLRLVQASWSAYAVAAPCGRYRWGGIVFWSGGSSDYRSVPAPAFVPTEVELVPGWATYIGSFVARGNIEYEPAGQLHRTAFDLGREDFEGATRRLTEVHTNFNGFRFRSALQRKSDAR